MSEPLRKAPPLRPRSIIPISPNLPGAQFQPRVDRVLQHLARYGDEREWVRVMDSSDAVGSAVEQRKMRLLSEGWEVRAGKSGSPRAEEMRAFVSRAFDRDGIKWGMLLSELLDVIFWGWRPIELIWDGEMSWEGRTAWSVGRVIARKPWNFKFGIDEALYYLPTGQRGLRIQLDAAPPRMLAPSYGDSETPYGRSFLSRYWLLWFVSQQFSKMSAQAMKRALGVFKAVKAGGGATMKDLTQPVSSSGVDSELKVILEILDANSVITEAGAWKLEHMPLEGVGAEGREYLRYFDEKLRIAVVGQTLTTQMQARGGGSFAATKEHGKVLEDFAQSDGLFLMTEIQPWINALVDVNFGSQAPDDYPCFHPLALQPFDLEATRAAYEMGAPIRAADLVRRGVPLVTGEPREGELVLQKAAAPAPEPPPERPPPLPRAIEKLAGGEAVSRMYEEAARRLLEANPDPSPGLS